jgi:hypothetical protein
MLTSDLVSVIMCPGYVVAQLVEAQRYKAEGFGFDSRSFRPHYGPGGRLNLKRKWVKAAEA